MRAMVAVMFGAGLRVSEALALLPRDLDLDAGTLRVRHGKGDRTRVTGLDPHSAALLARWVDRRTALGVGARVPIFCTYADGSAGVMDPRYVRAALARFGVRAGIAKRVHPHGLRHSHAFGLANEGVPVHLIQAQLGHASLAVTSRYVSHLAPTQVIAAMAQRNPYAPVT